jgi:hypothetical protein
MEMPIRLLDGPSRSPSEIFLVVDAKVLLPVPWSWSVYFLVVDAKVLLPVPWSWSV